ncbi:nucleotidyltransferase domain-containing protein [Streptomyces sp. NPDC059850]|uniref:nucleotidyltransferase domain-containing protein n=1 Tax=Streptomyces sp. NPDC059850 TaxID=3346970 RepID=UPI0036469DA4
MAAEVCTALERCCPGSAVELTGSLGSGTADAFSDIDIAWVVPDARFPDCLGCVAEVLSDRDEIRTRVQSLVGELTDGGRG